MKKTKILIPALSIASVGAVVAPMVTSCKSNDVVFTAELIKNGAAVEYEPETVKATGTIADDTKLNKKYYEAVSADPKILADDILYTFSNGAEQTAEWGCYNMTMSVVNPSVKLDYYSDSMSATIKPVLLWDFTIKGEWEWKDGDDSYTATYEFIYHNFVTYFYFDASGNVQPSRPNFDRASLMYWFHPKFTYNEGITIDGEYHTHSYEVTNYNEFQILYATHKYEASVFLQNFHIDPWYLMDVKKGS